MNKQRFAVLATQGDGVPYTNLVAFVCSDDLVTVVFMTPRDTSKFRNICRNPGVSLFIDNRSNSDTDIESAVGISVTGTASVLDDDVKYELLHKYLDRHPYLSDFTRAAGNALISVEVTRYTVVSGLTWVEAYEPRECSPE